MKKNFLYSIVVLCICLFAACSQEEIMDEAGQQAGKQVSLTVDVPGGVMTRALPTEQDHKLRCIMQVVDKDNKSITGEGMRQVVEVNADKMTFTFTAPEGDYKCLFWADFVTDIKADNVYTTTDLTNITYKKMDNDVFSTKADAFCGYVANGTATITLKRPFAKVSVAPKNASTFAGYNKLTVSYNAPSGFNMVTGAVSSTAQKVTYTKESFNASAGAWFTSFVFAPANVEKLGSDITMKIEGGTDGPKTLTIAANKVPLTPNYEIDGTFDAASGSNVNVDVSFDNGFIDPNAPVAPKVGDYFYSDGTWGASATKAGVTTVGVVFALASEGGAAASDAIGNYTGKNMTKINGWVVSATNVSGKKFLADETTATLPGGVGSTAADILGFANTNLWNAGNASTETYSAIKAALDYNTTVVVSTETNKNSGWYLPSAGQMTALIGVYAENNSNAQGAALVVKTKLQALLDAETGELMADGYHWSSTGILDKDSKVCAFRVGFHAATNYAKSGANNGLSSGSSVRPVLTF